MLYHVRMDVRIPLDMDADVKADLVAREKAYAQEVQRSGRWPHLWRVVGEYANVSIFDVESNDALHDLLSGLPLFPYMDIQVTPLAKHPSSIAGPVATARPPTAGGSGRRHEARITSRREQERRPTG